MKHLKPLALNESRTVSPIGYILYYRGTWYCGAFATFHRFAAGVIDEITGISDPDVLFIGDFSAFTNALQETLEGYGENDDHIYSDLNSMTLWWDENPKGALNDLVVHVGNGSPYYTEKILETVLSNTRALMTQWPEGRAGDPGFIGASIKNSPEQLDLYVEYTDPSASHTDVEPDFSLAEILTSVKSPDKDLAALIRYTKVRGQI